MSEFLEKLMLEEIILDGWVPEILGGLSKVSWMGSDTEVVIAVFKLPFTTNHLDIFYDVPIPLLGELRDISCIERFMHDAPWKEGEIVGIGWKV